MDKGELESHREATFIDDIIQKSHVERELLSNLDGIRTVLDGGAGCGRFSILLAKQGCKVTHFDISQPMIDKAKELAEKEGVLDRITFIKGALEELTDYEDKAFDMVISFDAPISYTYPNQEPVMELWSNGLIGGEEEIAEYQKGGTPWCITYSFMSDEMKNGVKNIELAGPGAHARTIPNELLVKIMNDSTRRSDFRDFCYQYDSNPFVCGMGKDNLFAKGEL